MGRVYTGLWRVRFTCETSNGEDDFYSPATTYDECQKYCAFAAIGVHYEGMRVKRAMIIGPLLN